MEKVKLPCEFDHNGECLICDCWPEHCAYMRMLNKDYKWESKEELEEMFKDLSDPWREILLDFYENYNVKNGKDWDKFLKYLKENFNPPTKKSVL